LELASDLEDQRQRRRHDAIENDSAFAVFLNVPAREPPGMALRIMTSCCDQ